MPVSPFQDPTSAPVDAALAARVGPALSAVDKALATIGGKPGQVIREWRFSKTSGWYLTYDRGGKRLFYLFPKDGDLLLKLVFNEGGVQAMRATPLPDPVMKKLARAKTYAEGTLLEFTAGEFTAALLVTLLRIKMASTR